MSLAPPATLGPGFRLDRYELLCPIADGGMASVWLARLLGKHGFEKLVAVKTILPRYVSDERFQRMFLDEARIASGIEHTNVARILDLGEEHDILYIVMEWVDGDSFSRMQRLLARKGIALPHGIVLRVMADACAGLHAVHELRARDGRPLNVVHRDVSPQNILVSTEGVTKVIDFGVAKALNGSQNETAAGTLKGKVQYMAPEQALGRTIDRRADIWSVGAVLYNFFAGRPVFEGESELAALQRLTSGEPPWPLPRKVVEPIASVIMGALHHNPDLRWATAAEMKYRLEKAMHDVGCMTSSAEVASFVAGYLPERAAARHQTIERALIAANQRVSIPVEPPSIQSSSGLLDVRARTPASLVTSQPPPPGARYMQRGPGTAETSSATLGSAALDTPGPHPPRFGIGLLLGAMAAFGVFTVGVAALLYVVRPWSSRAPAGPSVRVAAVSGRPAMADLPATAVNTPNVPPPPTSSTPTPTPVTIPAPTNVQPTPVPPPTGSTPLLVTGPSSGIPKPLPKPAAAHPPTPRPAAKPATNKAVDDGF
jgi:serine/threonine protein kinase